MLRKITDLVNWPKQLAHILSKSPKNKTVKILNCQLWQMEMSMQSQKPPSQCLLLLQRARELEKRLSQI